MLVGFDGFIAVMYGEILFHIFGKRNGEIKTWVVP